jgi:TonB family protein
MKRLAAICVVAAMTPVPQPPTQIRPRDAKKFVGKDVTVCGRVVNHGCSKAKDIRFLRLEHTDDVLLGIRSTQAPQFGERFEDRYIGADVCGSGRVERIEKRNVVMIEAPAAITFPGPNGPRSAIFAPGAVRECSPDVQLPVLRREVKPNYTQEAMRALIQGVVVLEAVVLPDGTVGDVRVIQSLDRKQGLDDQGMLAVKQWRFAPATLRGQVVPMIVNIELSFRLK